VQQPGRWWSSPAYSSEPKCVMCLARAANQLQQASDIDAWKFTVVLDIKEEGRAWRWWSSPAYSSEPKRVMRCPARAANQLHSKLHIDAKCSLQVLMEEAAGATLKQVDPYSTPHAGRKFCCWQQVLPQRWACKPAGSFQRRRSARHQGGFRLVLLSTTR
jgi:hypothetical protein